MLDLELKISNVHMAKSVCHTTEAMQMGPYTIKVPSETARSHPVSVC